MLHITTITQNATSDEQTAADYREMFEELREGIGLRKFVTKIESVYSFGQWSKYERGKADLTRAMRNELRRGVGLPVLPATVTEAMANVHPDAQVLQVGKEQPTRVILASTQMMTLHLNGDVTAVSARGRRTRVRMYRPALSLKLKSQIEKSGLTVSELIEIGLERA